MFLLNQSELITDAWAGCPFLLGGLCNRKSTFRRGEVLVLKQPPRGHLQVLFQLRKNTKHTWPAFVLKNTLPCHQMTIFFLIPIYRAPWLPLGLPGSSGSKNKKSGYSCFTCSKHCKLHRFWGMRDQKHCNLQCFCSTGRS